MPASRLTIATRESPLALWQAGFVADRLRALHPGLQVELLGMRTAGDRFLEARLASMGGKGLFVKELEQALLERRADLAVHSMKDVPVEVPAGLQIPVVMAREDPRDVLVAGDRRTGLAALPAGARVGTSSLRRRAQLRALRPDLEYLDLRGNLGTRLHKLAQGDFDAIVLAAAGLRRLGMQDEITEYFPVDTLIPAIGQGALGIECRSDDHAVRALVDGLHEAQTALCVGAERAFNACLNGGCHLPIAGHATRDGALLTLRGMVASEDGVQRVADTVRVAAGDAHAAGLELGRRLLDKGGSEILARLKTPPTS